MVDLNVLSEVGGFKHYLAKDTLGLMGMLKHPKHPPKYAPGRHGEIGVDSGMTFPKAMQCFVEHSTFVQQVEILK